MQTNSIAALAGAIGEGGDGDSRLVDRVVVVAREHLGMDVGFLAEFHGDQKVFASVAGDGSSFGFQEGGALHVDRTYCGRMVNGKLPNTIVDAQADPRVRELEITHEAGIGAYIGVPVRLASGRLYGTLCCLSHEPELDLRERDVTFMEALARIVGEEVGRDEAALDRRRALVDDVRRLLAGPGPPMVFQPIVDLGDRRLVGMESLARFAAQPRRPPDHWFAAAREAGLGSELELKVVRAALAHLDRMPPAAYLSVNASPRTLTSDAFAAELRRIDGRRVVVEVTEHDLVHEFDALSAARARLREQGVRVAIDDAGAGYSGLNRMVALAPDIIKLDRFLTRGIDRDPARRALASAAASFAAEARTAIVAEGIETEAELQALHAVGIRYGQGYHLARPARLSLDPPIIGGSRLSTRGRNYDAFRRPRPAAAGTRHPVTCHQHARGCRAPAATTRTSPGYAPYLRPRVLS